MAQRFAEVYPALPLPRGLDYFDYRIPDGQACREGQIVRMLFRRKKTYGLISKIKTTSSVPKKSLQTLLECLHVGVYTAEQLQLIAWTAREYHTSVGIVLRSVFITPSKIELREKIQEKKVGRKKDSSSFQLNFFQYDFTEPARDYVLELIEKEKNAGRSVLIVFPELFALEQFTSHFPHEHLVLHGSLPRKRQWMLRESIRQGGQVVFGTMHALYEPFTDLARIIVFDEASETLKQSDRQPHIHGRELALQLAQLHNVPITFVGKMPSLHLLRRLQTSKGKWQRSKNWGKGSSVQISSLKDEPREGPGGMLTASTAQGIRDVLAQKGKVVVFRNRRGNYSGLYCRECGWKPRCTRCSAPMQANLNGITCVYCRIPLEIPAHCPICKSIQLRPSGYGVEGNAKTLAALFPNAKILTLDKESQTSQDQLSAADIIVGTEKLFRTVLPEIRLVVLLSLDAELARPEWNNAETVYRHMWELRFLHPGMQHLIIQTHDPEQKALSHFSANTVAKFLQSELDERKRFAYPPFVRLVKLTRQHTGAETARQSAKECVALLTQSDPASIINEILPPRLQKIAGGEKYTALIYLKLSVTASPMQRNELFRRLPSEWMIDLDALA